MPRPLSTEHKLDLGPLPPANFTQLRSAHSTGADSPEYAGASPRYQLGNAMAAAMSAGTSRTTAGSPSKEFGASRLFPKRAREIQAQEGLSPQVWRPPPTGSGHSTPLRETIPESPTNNEFPDFNASSVQPPASATIPGPIALPNAPVRRSRAGTVPSRFSPEELNSLSISPGLSASRSSLISPASSVTTPLDSSFLPSASLPSQLSPAATSTLLSRLRAGSMPQRTSLVTNLKTFGPTYIDNNGWPTARSRASTMQGAQSAELPSVSSRGHFGRESFADGDAKTLDYLGLVDSPAPGKPEPIAAPISNPLVAQLAALNDLKKNANRLRSYSVNAKERYDDYDDDVDIPLDPPGSAYAGAIGHFPDGTPAHASAVQEAVRQHNLDVQLFAHLANANRPRAQTASMLESPTSRISRNYLPTPSRLENSMSAADMDLLSGEALTDAVRGLHIHTDTGLDDSVNDTPSRALWLGNIPPSTTVSSLNAIFESYGPIESTRILTHKSCGFVNFENIESAVLARAQLHNKELFPGGGPIRIGFAKAPSGTATPGLLVSNSPESNFNRATSGSAKLSSNINAETAAAALKTPQISDLRNVMLSAVQELGAAGEELLRISDRVDNAISYDLYYSEPPPPTEPSPDRIHDAPKLREFRKRMDSSNCSPDTVEQIAMEMLPEIAELSSDYLGNTVVQKLFENCTEETKELMLETIAPRLAETGMHKNGTWAAQKIIDVAHTPAQMTMIVDALRPHTVQLFLDQYGNYVIQCCLKFGAPYNDFIFDCMLQRMWEVAQGRFGARAMRACLESHYATKDQQRMMAAAVALHSVRLATNSNGALLLTWFLDTCTFPNRRAVLAPRLIAHLVHLCTHKVAYLTVLKVINQRAEPEARDEIVCALFTFTGENVLEDILSDQACGATFVYKVLSTPFLGEKIRPEAIENVRNVLNRLNAQPSQGYKRLMDEVGLSTRNTPASARSRDVSSSRSASRSRGPAAFKQGLDQQQQLAYGDYQYNNLHQLQTPEMLQAQRASSFDSTVMDPYVAASAGTPSYTHSPSLPSGLPPLTAQQIQYQQAMLAQQQANANAQRGNGYLHSPISAGYRTTSPGLDAFGRPPSMNGSPLAGAPMGQNFAQPGYSPMMAMGGYQYPIGYFPQPQQLQGQVGGQRRGRANGQNR